MATSTIDKVAWLHVVDGRVLCVRSFDKDAFYLPGGKRESGESDEDCLRREILEELGVALRPETLRPDGVFEAQAHGKPEGTMVRMACYGAGHAGELQAKAEIAEFAWLGYADRGRCSRIVATIFDALHRQDRIA